MTNATKNWMATSNYDLKTAEAMLKSKRYIYVVFMCHLAIEKMIKAVISTEIKELPPKSHSLLYLSQKISIQFPDDIQDFIDKIDNVSIVTRYPEDLKKISKDFNLNKAEEVYSMTRKTLRWLRQDRRLKQ
ncbi:MAG: HEPN domain-containing protein [Nitrospirae bacterium]|nr:HEPN domain-containing protein [Nitrospirota bacterium]